MDANRVFAALSSPPRRRIIAFLAQTALSTADLASRFGMSAPSMSRHLAVLLAAGLVSSERLGQRVLYRLKRDALLDELTWSRELAKSLPLEQGETVAAAAFSRQQAGSPALGGWEPFLIVRGNTPTDYRLVEDEGIVVLRAESREGGSGLQRKIHIDLRRHPVMEWRWRVPRDAGRGGADGPSRTSPPVRISLAFDGDPDKLDFDDRAKLRIAKALTVHGLPYASLLYVWLNREPAETAYSSPHTERVRHIVVESGEGRLDQWVSVRRNVLEDYRRAFGEEPGDIVAVGIMVDYGDNGAPRSALIGDITFRPR
jgi:DNA-binding transcriptional ArsR family regulator